MVSAKAVFNVQTLDISLDFLTCLNIKITRETWLYLLETLLQQFDMVPCIFFYNHVSNYK